MNRPILACAATIALSAALAAPASAETMVSTGAAYGYNVGDAAIGFTLASGFTNVSISADIVQYGDVIYPGGNPETIDTIGPLVAYITTSIGSSTTEADVLDTSSQTIGFNYNGVTTLFSGVTLGPGSYYLVIQTPVNTDVFYSRTKNYTLGTGVSNVTNSFGEDSPSFEPSDTFESTAPVQSGTFVATFTGTPETTVPEPMTLSLVGIGLASLAAMRRRRC
jgi:hypothetical protein